MHVVGFPFTYVTIPEPPPSIGILYTIVESLPILDPLLSSLVGLSSVRNVFLTILQTLDTYHELIWTPHHELFTYYYHWTSPYRTSPLSSCIDPITDYVINHDHHQYLQTSSLTNSLGSLLSYQTCKSIMIVTPDPPTLILVPFHHGALLFYYYHYAYSLYYLPLLHLGHGTTLL